MSHFAEVDENNIVVRVLVGDNSLTDEGLSFFESLGGRWVQTSYNGTLRKNFAGIGHSYDEERDAFVAPQPYPSWILNETTCRWESPVPAPEEGVFIWDEPTLSWIAPE